MSQQGYFYFLKSNIQDKKKLVSLPNLKNGEHISQGLYFFNDCSTTFASLYLKNDIHISFYERYDERVLQKEIINSIKRVYLILKVGGYGYNEYDGDGDEYEHFPHGTSRQTMSRIWSVNLFLPPEVKKYGREKLLNAPCELIEEWEDGAIFMMIHKDRFSSTYEERKKLREYLGVK